MDHEKMEQVNSEQEIAQEKTENEKQKGKGLAGEIYSILHDFAYILAAVTIIFVFVVRLVGVDGSSMFPTLVNRDYMLLQSNFLCGDYENGDIVVLTVPTFGQNPLVKRIVATEGQTIDIDFDNGIVYVDGVALEEDYIYEPTFRNYDEGLTYPATVPEGCVFVMGDNRNNSTDSRYAPVGMVDTRRIMGKVRCIVFPGRQTDVYGYVVGGHDFSRIGGVS